MRVTQENIAGVITHLQEQDVLSLDTETTGLEEIDRPFSFIIADATTEYYFDERELIGPWPLRFAMGVVFGSRTKKWIFQNAKFDMRMMGMIGHTIAGECLDIAIMARLVRNDHMAYSLDAQAKRHGMLKGADKIKAYIKEHDLYEVRKNFFGEETKQPRYDRVPLELMEAYACMDARITYDLYHIYLPQIEQMGASKVWETEVALTKVCFQMERYGLLLNKEYTLEAMYAERETLQKFKSEYESITGVPYVNSAKSFQKAFPDALLPKTDAGNPSLTDEVLEELIHGDQVTVRVAAKLVQEIRHLEKRSSTYFESYLNRMDRNGVVHPTMWQAGTKTGRFSYSDPNLQNIPKEKGSDSTHVVRGCFKPRPGHVFVSFDYAQMEYRLMAAYANETEIIRRVMAGEDFHTVAADLFGVERDPAKTLNFAVLYGAGDDKLARMLGVVQQAARRLKLKYFMALPRVENLIDRIKSVGKARGYVTTWLGRNLFSDPQFVYALPNHLIQGGGADVVKVAMVKIAKAFPQIRMVLQVHDQLIFELTPDQYIFLPDIKSIMESAFPEMNGMRLAVDVEWSDKSLAVRDMKKGYPNAAA